MAKRILIVACLVLGAGLAFLLFTFGPRNLVGMIRYDQRRDGTLRVGDRAPDVELLALDGVSRTRLSASIGGQPLVLVFGSYT